MAIRREELFNQDEIDAIAEKYDRRARKDTTLNMRISTPELEELKEAARLKGYEHYQQWVYLVLAEAVHRALGHEVETFD